MVQATLAVELHKNQVVRYRVGGLACSASGPETYARWGSSSPVVKAGLLDGQGDHHTPSIWVEKVFRKYLLYRVFARGVAIARCDNCGHESLLAFASTGRGVCPSWTTRRMAEAAAHLAPIDEVLRLICPLRGGEQRTLALITVSADTQGFRST